MKLRKHRSYLNIQRKYSNSYILQNWARIRIWIIINFIENYGRMISQNELYEIFLI